MAKNTNAQEAATGTSDSYTEHELSDPHAPEPIRITRAMLGGEVKSVGDNSTQSSESERTSSVKPKASPPLPAPTMEKDSSAQMTEPGSDAPLTDGGTLSNPQKQSASPAKKTTPAKKASPAKKTTSKEANIRTLSDDDDF